MQRMCARAEERLAMLRVLADARAGPPSDGRNSRKQRTNRRQSRDLANGSVSAEPPR